MEECTGLAARVHAALDTVKDPCMQAAGLDISLVGLGIVKDIAVVDDRVTVTLALTEPGCGFTHVLVTQVEDAVAPIVAPRALDVAFDWHHGWHEGRMREDARAQFAAARKRAPMIAARLGPTRESSPA